jgi:uncharacterized protein (DUF342 family)
MNYSKEIRYDDLNALEKILKKRQFFIDQHHKMIQANKAHIILKAAFTNEEILELAQRIVSNNGKPYSDEEIWQNKAARQRIGQRLEIFKKRQSIASKTHEFNGGSVAFNSRKNKVQIRFDKSAGFKLKAVLAEQGFRYFARTKTWDRLLSDEAWEVAMGIVNTQF